MILTVRQALAGSIGLHAAIVGLALWTGRRAPGPAAPQGNPAEEKSRSVVVTLHWEDELYPPPPVAIETTVETPPALPARPPLPQALDAFPPPIAIHPAHAPIELPSAEPLDKRAPDPPPTPDIPADDRSLADAPGADWQIRKPSYPWEARRRGEEGAVTVRIAIDTRGHPTDVVVVQTSGSTELDRAAVAAARRSHFGHSPRDRADILLTFRFRLEE